MKQAPGTGCQVSGPTSRLFAASGYAYRSEILWRVAGGQVFVFPTALRGLVQVGFTNELQAIRFVDALLDGGARGASAALSIPPVYGGVA